MSITAQDLISREVHYCVSALVHIMATADDSNGFCGFGRNSVLPALFNQAFELSAPVADYEEAAQEAGWNGKTVEGTFWNSFDGETVEDVSIETYQDLCEELDIEPYYRDVYEHWIVSDWLADKLIEKGEKVDKDFAGMTIWARTTTGQAIYCDHVIEQITAELNAA